MKTFIRVTEIWLPSEDGSLLEFGGGLYGQATHFGVVSRAMCFGRGEGLPGRAWEEGHPIVLKQLEGSYFRRGAAAREAGLTCAIAVPIFAEEALRAVVVFFCADDAEQAGAIELWHNDPRITSDLTLVEGYYGHGAEALETLSRDAYLPRGAGLPGLAWQQGAAVFMPDLATAKFLRSETAAAAGIQRGLAIPCTTRSNESCVMTFLSGPVTPIAARVESWTIDATAAMARRTFGYCEATERPLDATAEIDLASGEGAVAAVFMRGAPVLSGQAQADPGPVGEGAVQAQAKSLLALPIYSEGLVAEVVVLYF